MNRKIDFTLIELIIVISIIAILASMLLPALNRVRSRARDIQCIGNLKQVAQGVRMYLDAYQEYFYCPYTATNYNTFPYWNNILIRENFLETDQVLFCPSQKPSQRNFFRTYGAYYVNSGGTSSYPALSLKNSLYARTGYSKIWMAGCCYSIGAKDVIYRMYSFDNASENFGRPHLIHGERTNAFYLDGHVASRGRLDLGNDYTLHIYDGIIYRHKYAVDAAGNVYFQLRN